MKFSFLLSVFAICSIVVLSCTKDKVPVVVEDPGACPDTISFSATVMPLINTNCSTSGCHDAANAGGYTLTNYSEVSANATVILNVMRHDAGFTPMPFGGNPLPADQIQHFDCWILQGKLDN